MGVATDLGARYLDATKVGVGISRLVSSCRSTLLQGALAAITTTVVDIDDPEVPL